MYPHLAQEFLDIPHLVETVEAHDNTIGFYTFSTSPAFSAVSTRVQGRRPCARNGMVSPTRYKAAELVTWRHCFKFFESRSSLNLGAKHENASKYEQCVCISAGNIRVVCLQFCRKY